VSSVLIRQSVSRGESRTFHDIELDVSEVTIGADANNTIPLRGESVRGKHAVVVTANGVVQVRAIGREKIVVNGLLVNRVDMSPGDRLTIDQNVIVVLPSPPGFELALQVETADPGREQNLEAVYLTNPNQTRISKRVSAWTLGLLTLTLFFIVPLVVSQYFAAYKSTTPMMFTDYIWLSGPISRVHLTAAENDCSQCHTELFSRVPDTACTSCHEAVAVHTSADQLAELGHPDKRCASCHREHNEPAMLVGRSGADCVNCHSFTSLAEGHPAFSDYPNPGRPSIMFDHSAHQLDHYQETELVFECGSCHNPDTAGQHQTTATFESMCVDCHGDSGSSVASKVFHHGDQIVSADPIAVFTLPRVDLKTLAKTQTPGAWPEAARKGSRTGLTRLGITPFTELLLAADPQAGPAISRLKQNKIKLSSLKKANDADLADSVVLIWAIKRLLADFSINVDATLTARLAPMLLQPPGKRELAALSGQIPPLLLLGVITDWFPKDTGNGLEEDLKNAPLAGLPAEQLSKSGTGTSGLPGTTWVRTGLWQEQKSSIQYQPSGHADSFVKAWLDMTLEILQNPELDPDLGPVIHAAAQQLFDALYDSDADPGKARGAGRCSKCHSQIFDANGKGKIAWSASQLKPVQADFTRFSHAEHESPGKEDVCTDCHQPIEKGEFMSAYATDAKPATYVSSFSPIDAQTCSSCHAQDRQASDQCLNCHNYHVAAKPGLAKMRTLTKPVQN